MFEWGSYYKIGVHGKAFFFDDGDWKKSDKEPAEVIRRIRFRIELEKNQGTSRFLSGALRSE